MKEDGTGRLEFWDEVLLPAFGPICLEQVTGLLWPLDSPPVRDRDCPFHQSMTLGRTCQSDTSANIPGSSAVVFDTTSRHHICQPVTNLWGKSFKDVQEKQVFLTSLMKRLTLKPGRENYVQFDGIQNIKGS